MSIPFLPSLKEGASIAITKNGKWTAEPQNTLPTLTDSLKVVLDDESKICSIPDVWARPLLFSSILENKDAPELIRKQYVGEWRGVLALLALRKLRHDTNLKIENVMIPDPQKLIGNEPEFIKVIARSIPKHVFGIGETEKKDSTLEGTDYIAKVQILTYERINKEVLPIAIFWPTTLVCTSLNLEKVTINEILWWGINGLEDPIEHLSDLELELLKQWIEYVLKKAKSTGYEVSDFLARLLLDYQKDIKKKLSGKNISAKNVPSELDSLGITGPCSIIDLPISVEETGDILENSHVLLESKKNPDAKKMLVISSDLGEQWGCKNSEIMIGGSHSVASKLKDGYLDNIREPQNALGSVDLTKLNAEVIIASKFFTDTIGVIFMELKTFENSINANKIYDLNDSLVNIIPPIRKELLDYLEPEYIAEHTKIKIDGGNIEVSLPIPVTGNGIKKYIIAKKTYCREVLVEDKERIGVIKQLGSVPTVQIWPNFIMKKPELWCAYYTFFDAGERDTFKVEPYWNGNVKKAVIERRGLNTETTLGDKFPDAMICYLPVKDSYSNVEMQELGCILLEKPQPIMSKGTNSEWTIGIDFGTTNTVVYKSVNGEDESIIGLKNRIFNVCKINEDGVDANSKATTRQLFLPYGDYMDKNNPSIKTMYHKHQVEFKGEGKPEEYPILPGNIYYVDGMSNLNDDKSIMNSVTSSEMKWGSETGGEEREAYLKQLAMQSLAEAVYNGATKINWKYSYPAAFSMAEQMCFEDIWVPVVDKHLGIIPKLTTIEISEEVVSLTESDCVARYFSNSMKARIYEGIICLDIGGGSTDIAVWQGRNKELEHQSSLRIAGKHIMNDYLWIKQQNALSPLKALEKENDALNEVIESVLSSSNRNEFNIKLETLLKDHEADLFNNLRTAKDNSQVKRMTRDICFVLSGIFYYSGMLVGTMMKNDYYSRKDILPSIYIAGNASKLLDWAGGGSFKKQISSVFKTCYIAGVKKQWGEFVGQERIEINKTDMPKQEVAYGLVTNKETTSSEAKFNGYIAGERFFVDNQEVDEEFITARDYLKGVEISYLDIPDSLKSFAEVFDGQMKKIGYTAMNLKDDEYDDIVRSTNQVLADINFEARGDEDNVKAEPLFIILLKEAYKVIAERKEND